MNYSNVCGGTSPQYSNAVGRVNRRRPIGRPSTGQMIGGGSCSVTVTSDGKTSTCHGTMSRRGVCKPCNKMAGVKSIKTTGGSDTFMSRNRGNRYYPSVDTQFGFGGMPTTSDSETSVTKYVMGLAGVGILFFVIGYGYKTGVTKA
tara:strand:- start:442 stop:879 length:438 start_codon:yes stop_codon:yes gene_type:complete